MKDCEDDFQIHYTQTTDEEYNKEAKKWKEENLPSLLFNEEDYRSGTITLDGLSRETITKAASLIATKRCDNTELVID